MRRILLMFLLIILLQNPGYTTTDPLGRSMQHFKKHQYQQAADILYSGFSKINSAKTDQASLTMGMICLSNAELYRELYHASIIVHMDYLTKLVASEQNHGQGYVKLYLAKTLLEAGKLIEAAGYFKKCLVDKTLNASIKTDAHIGLGTAFYLQGKVDRAKQEWQGIQRDNPETITSLALAHSRVGLKEEKPLETSRQIVAQSNLARISNIRIINNVLGVFAREAAVADGLQLIQQSDLKTYFHEEKLAKNKVLRYYDPALLSHLALLYGNAAIQYLQKATKASNPKIKWSAQYHLALAHGQFGSVQKSQQLLTDFINAAPFPPKLKYRASVRQAINRHLTGNSAEAKHEFDALLKTKYKSQLSAEILMQSSRYELDYPPAVTLASAAVQKGTGKPFARVNHALGKHYLWKKNYLKAAALLENARDKSNKNRIEFNDPLLLVDLSVASYRVKRFSESLEIYFAMSKQFPAVRQIQMVMQGVYSMEQKSAGDAKIF